MIIAMFLAHLVGDYVLQWDQLALWKSREVKGVLVHGLVVFIVTWLFTLPFDPTWWQGVVLISATHVLVDMVQFWIKPPLPALVRFVLDQGIHIGVILFALWLGGYLRWSTLVTDLVADMQAQPLLTFLLAYAFITMPAWVLLKFLTYGLVKGCAPNFPENGNKYLGIAERILITTFVAMGQFLLVPLVTLPRLVFDWRRLLNRDHRPVYLFELLASVILAVVTGLSLRGL